MITALLFDTVSKEAQDLEQAFRRLTAFHTDEKLQITYWMKLFPNHEAAGNNCNPDFGLQDMHPDMAVIDVTQDAGIEAAIQIRQRYPHVQILVIADVSVSPMRYLNPDIQPSSLLLRPWDQEQGNRIMEDFFLLTVRPLKGEDDSIFWARTRDGVQKIPYREVLYFEAREKKIFIRTQRMEYGIAGTIEKIAQKLPKNFFRCHRSYIVNRDYIERVRLSEGMVFLPGSVSIPVSRSYKSMIKEYAGD